MIFKTRIWETAIERHERLCDWHPFFAVIPRRVSPSRIAVLEMIQRKGTYNKLPEVHESSWSWKYSL